MPDPKKPISPTAVVPKRTPEESIAIISKKVSPTFLPFTENTAQKQVYTPDGATKTLPIYHNWEKQTDMAYDRESNQIYKYDNTEKKWVYDSSPTPLDTKFSTLKAEYQKKTQNVSAKGIDKMTQGYSSKSPFSSSPNFAPNPLVVPYIEAKQNKTNKLQQITTVDGTMVLDTYKIGDVEYGINPDTKTLYKRVAPEVIPGLNFDFGALIGSPDKKEEDRWIKEKDLNNLDLIQSHPDVTTYNQIVEKAQIPWMANNVFKGVDKSNPIVMEKQSRQKMVELYNQSEQIGKSTIINGGKNLSSQQKVEYLQNPLNVIQVFDLGKGLANDEAKADLVEYLALLKAQGYSDSKNIKYVDQNGQTRIQKSYDELVADATKILNRAQDFPSLKGDVSEQQTALQIRQGLIAYQGEKQRIKINEAAILDKVTIDKVTKNYEQYGAAYKKSEDFKKKYDEAVLKKDYALANKYANILNIRTEQLKKVAPTKEEKDTYDKYVKLLGDTYKDYKTIYDTVKDTYPEAYNENEKQVQIQKKLQEYDVKHPYLGGLNQLQRAVIEGTNGALSGIASTPARFLSDRKKYDSFDIFADRLDDSVFSAKEKAFDNNPNAPLFVKVAQSSGYSLGMMMPAIALSAIAPQASIGVLASRGLQFGATYTSIFSDYRRQGIEQGLSEEESTHFANISAAINSVLELFVPTEQLTHPASKLFNIGVKDYTKLGLGIRGGLKGPAFREFLGGQLQNFAGEFTEEILQGGADYLIQRHYNGEKLTKFDVDSNLGDLTETALSVALTNLLMGAGSLKSVIGVKSEERQREAIEFLSRNFENFSEYAQNLKNNNTIEEKDYLEYSERVGEAHTLLNLSKPEDFFMGLGRLQETKRLSPSQINNLRDKHFLYINLINKFTPEQNKEFKSLNHIEEKVDYLNSLLDTKTETPTPKEEKLKNEEVIIDNFETPPPPPTPEQKTAEVIKQKMPFQQKLEELSLSHEQLQQYFDNPSLLNDENASEEDIKSHILDLLSKPETSRTGTNTPETSAPTPVQDVTKITRDEYYTMKGVEREQYIQNVLISLQKETNEEDFKNAFDKLQDKIQEIGKDKSKREEYIRLLDLQERVIMTMGYAVSPESNSFSIQKYIEESNLEIEKINKKKSKDIPLQNNKESQSTPEEENVLDGYELYQDKHLPGSQKKVNLYAKDKKTGVLKRVEVKDGKITLAEKTSISLEAKAALVLFDNYGDVKGTLEMLSNTAGVLPPIEIKATNYTGETAEQKQKRSKALDDFFGSNPSQQEIINAITLHVESKVVENNQMFLEANPPLSVQTLINSKHILLSKDKLAYLKADKGNKVVAIRRNTGKDVFFTITIKDTPYTSEISFPGNYVILENVNGTLVQKPFSFKDIKKLSEFQELFGIWGGTLTEEHLKEMQKQENIKNLVYSLNKTGSFPLSSIPQLVPFLMPSVKKQVAYGQGLSLREAFDTFNKLWSNAGKGLFVFFRSSKGGMQILTNNEDKQADLETEFNNGYFAQVTDDKGKAHFVKIYLKNPPSETTKTSILKTFEEFNNKFTFTNNSLSQEAFDENENIAKEAVKKLNELLFIQHSVYNITFRYDGKKGIQLDLWNRDSKTKSYIDIPPIKNSLISFEEFTQLLNNQLSSKQIVLDDTSFKESLAKLTGEDKISDEELKDKFIISTEPYVFTERLFLSWDESNITSVDEILTNESPVEDDDVILTNEGSQMRDENGDIIEEDDISKNITEDIKKLQEKPFSIERDAEIAKEKIKQSKNREKRSFMLEDGISGRVLTKKEMDAVLKEMPKHIGIRWKVAMKNLRSGGVPLGYFLDNCISLSKNAKSTVLYHEQFHAIFRTVLTTEEINKYLALEKANMLAKDKEAFSQEKINKFISQRGYDISNQEAIDLMIEESLADGYMLMREKKYVASKYLLTKLFNDLKEFISAVIANNKIKSLYRDISLGKYANATIKSNRFDTIGYPIYAVLNGWDSVVGGNSKSKELISLVTARTLNELSRLRVETNKNVRSLSVQVEQVKEILNNIVTLEKSLLVELTKEDNDFLSQEQKEKFSEQSSLAIAVMEDEDNIDVIVEQVIENVARHGWKSNTELDEEEGDDTKDQKGYDKSIDEEGNLFTKLATEVKEFFNSVIYEKKDEFGVSRSTTVDGAKMYNYLLRASQSIDKADLFPQLDKMADKDVELAAVLKKFYKITGYSPETAHTFKNYGISMINYVASHNLKGAAFYNKFIDSLDRVRIDHVTVLNKRDGSIRVINTNSEAPEEYQYSQWKNEFLRKKVNIKALTREFSNLIGGKAYRDPLTSKVTIERLLTALNAVGINLKAAYVEYSFSDEVIEGAPKLDITFISQLSSALEKGHLFTESEEDINGRLMDVSKGNALFNSDLFEDSFKTADGKIRSSYISPNFLLIKSKEIARKFGIIQNWLNNKTIRPEDEGKVSEATKYKENPYFKLNPLFSLFTVDEINKNFGLWRTAIGGDFKNENDTNGVSYKDTDDKTLLVTVLAAFANIKSLAKYGGVSVTSYQTQQMESSSTLYLQQLPVIKNLYTQDNKISEKALDTLYTIFEQEMERINGKYFVDRENNHVDSTYPGAVNLQEICKNKLFANSKFLNEPLEKAGILTVNRNKKGKVVSASMPSTLSPEQITLIKEEIKKYHEEAFQRLITLLMKHDIIKYVVDMSNDTSYYTSAWLGDPKEIKSKWGSLQGMMGNFYLNQYIMSVGFNQLMYGDYALSTSDDDSVKRIGKGANAYGPSYEGLNPKIVLTSEALFNHPTLGEINLNDGQGEISTKFAIQKAFRRGAIKNQLEWDTWKKLLDGVESAEEFEQLQNERGFNIVDGIQRTKSVANDDQFYDKSSETILFKNFTSYFDAETKTWLPIVGMEKAHNKREWMEKHDVDLLLPISASKRRNPSEPIDHKFFEGSDFNLEWNPPVTNLQGKYYREQVQTESHGWSDIAFTSQLFQILQSELPEKYDGKKDELNKILAKMKHQTAISAFSQLEKEVETEHGTSRNIRKWLKNTREGVMKNTPDMILDELLKVDENGDFMYDSNLPHVVKKIASYYINTFAKANSPRLSGRSLILRSSEGIQPVIEKDGEIIRREDYLLGKDKTGYTARELKVHTFKNGNPSWGEIAMSRGAADRLGLKIGDSIPTELLKGIGIRIPTQSHHSITFFKIVDFLPEFLGDTVIIPKEIINLSGADFDVDKMFVLLKSFYKDKYGNVKVYGEGVHSAQDRWKEWSKWYKYNDTYTQTMLEEMQAGSPEYSQEEVKSRQLKTKLNKLKKDSYDNPSVAFLILEKRQAGDKLTAEEGKSLPNLKKIEKLKTQLADLEERIKEEKAKSNSAKEIENIEKEIQASYKIREDLKRSFYETIIKEEPLPYTLEDFEKDPNLKALPSLNNDLLDVMTELLTAPELAESYETPASMEIIETTGKDIFQKILKESYDSELGNSVLGILQAYNNNMTGKRLVGPHAMSNISGIYLEKTRTQLSTKNAKGQPISLGINFNDKYYADFTNKNYKEDDITLNIEEIIHSIDNKTVENMNKWSAPYLLRRINDSISSLVSAATDNAKKLGMKTLGHTMDTAGIWDVAIKLGMGQINTNLFSKSPIITQLLTKFVSRHTYLNPDKTPMNSIIDSFIYSVGGFNEDKLKALSKEGTNTTELIKAMVYSRIIEEGGELSQEEAEELKIINVKILLTFNKLRTLSEGFIKLGNVLSPNKKIKGDFETFEKVVESYDFLISPESPFEIQDVFEKDATVQQSMSTVRGTIALGAKFFIEKTPYVQETVKTVLKDINTFNQKKAKLNMSSLIYKYLVMKTLAYTKKLEGMDIISKYGTLVLEGKGSIVDQFTKLVVGYKNADGNFIEPTHPELKDNLFIKHLRVKELEGGRRVLQTTSNINFNPFTEMMVDSFKLMLYNEEEISSFAKSLIYYLAFKDGFDFKFNSYVKYLSPGIFYDFSQATKKVNRALFTNTPLEEALGITKEEATKEFIELYARSEEDKEKFNKMNVVGKVINYDDGYTPVAKLSNDITDADGKVIKKGSVIFNYSVNTDGKIIFVTANGVTKKDIKGITYLFPVEKAENAPATEPLYNFRSPVVITLANGNVALLEGIPFDKGGKRYSTYIIKKGFNNGFMSSMSMSPEFYEKHTINVTPKSVSTFNEDLNNDMETWELNNVPYNDESLSDKSISDQEEIRDENLNIDPEDENYQGGNQFLFNEDDSTPSTSPNADMFALVSKYDKKSELTTVITPSQIAQIEEILKEQGITPKYHLHTLVDLKKHLQNSLEKATVPSKIEEKAPIEGQRITIKYPETISIGKKTVSSAKLIELSKIEEENFFPYTEKGEFNYFELVQKEYGEDAGDYVVNRDLDQLPKELGTWIKNNPEEYDTIWYETEDVVSLQELAKQILEDNKIVVDNAQLTLFGLDVNNQDQLEFHINTLGVISQFLEDIGVEQRLVPQFLSENGTIVEGALAAANFIKGTVDIIDDVEKRPSAWNKLPEEAAHWWYRLLDVNSSLKDALLQSAKTTRKEEELRDSLYGEMYKGPKLVGQLALDENNNVTQKQALSPIREEAIGQLIAEAIKRIEERNGSPKDYSFFKQFVEFINSIIKKVTSLFKEQDPFEVAAMKILTSDLSDLLSWEEYNKLHNEVYFTEVVDNQSSAPFDYSLIEHIGMIITNQYDLPKVEEEDFFQFGKGVVLDPYGDVVKPATDLSPKFKTRQELDKWMWENYGRIHNVLQEKIANEVIDNQKFFDRLLNKTFKKKSRYLPKTLKKYYSIQTASSLYRLHPISLSENVQNLTKKMSPQEIDMLESTNGYMNIGPTLKVLPDLLKKYKNNPLSLTAPVKIDGAKKQDLAILNGVKDLIKLENPDKNSIKIEDFIGEVHSWLETNYLLGFANEQNYLSYRVDQIFANVPDRVTNEPSPLDGMTEEQMMALPLAERQRIASIVGLTKQNPSVYHNKVSLRFNNTYHEKSSHFPMSPSAWGNLTYFYTGKSKYKDAVLLHEIQNDNIEHLRAVKLSSSDIENTIGDYLKQLNTTFLSNLETLKTNKKTFTSYLPSFPPMSTHTLLNERLSRYLKIPVNQGFTSFTQEIQEEINLFKSDVSNNFQKVNKNLHDSHTKKRVWMDFLTRGGIASLLEEKDLKDLEELLKEVNNTRGPEYEQDEYGYIQVDYIAETSLVMKKAFFRNKAIEISDKVNKKLTEMYGHSIIPSVNFTPAGAPLPKNQRNPRKIKRGREVFTIGNTSKNINESVKFLLYNSEKQILKDLSKAILEDKKEYVRVRNNFVKNNFNQQLVKISGQQFSELIENVNFNLNLLDTSITLAAKREANSEGDVELNADDVFKIEQQTGLYEKLKKEALAKKEELEEKYKNVENEIKQTLELEMNYFTPLIHYLLQKHISQYGKNFPMYFSGYNITKLTQGSDRTSLIYAGKDEINIVNKTSFDMGEDRYSYTTLDTLDYRKNGNIIPQQEYDKAYQQATEQFAKKIKYSAAVQIGLLKDSPSYAKIYEGIHQITDNTILDEGIKKLNEYKKQSKQNLDRAIHTMMNLSNNKPIETGAIYNAMSQISGVKLVWQENIPGFRTPNDGTQYASLEQMRKEQRVGGYLVDLSNYNYETPILFGLNTQKSSSYSEYSSLSNEISESIWNTLSLQEQKEIIRQLKEC